MKKYVEIKLKKIKALNNMENTPSKRIFDIESKIERIREVIFEKITNIRHM